MNWRNLDRRLSKVEGRAAEPDLPASVPAAWAAHRPDGGLAGPAADESVTDEQRAAFDELAMMDSTIPFCE